MSEKQTEIAELGEFGLIDRLTRDLTKRNESTIRGVGDDAAVLDYSKDGNRVLVSTDLLVEGGRSRQARGSRLLSNQGQPRHRRHHGWSIRFFW